MPAHPTSRAELQKAVDAVEVAGGNNREASRMLGLDEATVRRRILRARADGITPTPGTRRDPDAPPPILTHPEATVRCALALVRERGSIRAAAQELGLNPTTVRNWVQSPAKALGRWDNKPDAAILRAPDEGRSVEEILADRRREFDRQANAHSDRLIPVRIKIPGPIGILHAGDPHLDNPGCDIYAIQRHIELVQQTPGMFAATVCTTPFASMYVAHVDASARAKVAPYPTRGSVPP
jgi:transposase